MGILEQQQAGVSWERTVKSREQCDQKATSAEDQTQDAGGGASCH